jgi:integrase
MPSIDKRGQAWRVRVHVLGFKRISRSFDTREEAELWGQRQEAKLLVGQDPSVQPLLDITLDEALDRYAKEFTSQKKGEEQELRRIGAWKRHEVAKVKLSRLSSSHFISFKEERIAGGVKDGTIRLDLLLISHLFKMARKAWQMKWLTNPIADMIVPKQGPPRNRRLTEAESIRFIDALKGCRNKFIPQIIRVAMETTARQGELLKLQRNDVDLGRRVMLLRGTKNGDDRAVPLSKRAIEILLEVKCTTDSRVFPITHDSIMASWRRIMARAKIDDFNFHDLRHEGTSCLFERRLEVMEVQKITGHKTLSMLLAYTHLNVSKIVDRLDETECNVSPGSAVGTAAELLRADVLAVPAAGAQKAGLVRDSATVTTKADGSNVLPFKRPR